MGSIVAIIGRPNVGKSTLFNRLTGTRDAIVDEVSGVTRDRHYGKADWSGREFTVIDTGGYIKGSDDVFESEIRRQVEIAMEEADVLLFVVDVEAGVTALDEDVAHIVRRAKRKTILVANKADNNMRNAEAGMFYSLGLGEVFPISSLSGAGTGELLDELINLLPIEDIEEEEPEVPRIAIVGRPNVGKSSFVNALLGNERNIVTSIAGTTRDAIHTRYKAFGHDFFLVDTAGLRKKARVHDNLEFYSVMRTVRVLESCDVCVIMIDATEGIEAQDVNIVWLAARNNKGVVILVNKWDLVENKTTNSAKEFTAILQERIAPFRDVPVIFTSVTEKQRLLKAIETAVEVFQNRKQRIPTHKLNELLLPIIADTPPPSVKGKDLKIKYITQLKTPYPSFVFFCNMPQYFKDGYKRFLENKLRELFPMTGVTIKIYFRQK